MRTRQEHQLCALCHLFNAIPLWGLLFCGWIWYAMREESRLVTGQARQSMFFHGLMMSGAFIFITLDLFVRVINYLSPMLGSILSMINITVMSVFMVLYVGCCLWGAHQSLKDQSFRYPIVGKLK